MRSPRFRGMKGATAGDPDRLKKLRILRIKIAVRIEEGKSCEEYVG